MDRHLIKLSVVFTMLLCLGGCTRSISPVIKSFNTIQPGAVETKQLGEALYAKGTVTVLPGFVAERDTDLPLMGYILFPPVRRGDVWTCSLYLKDDYLCLYSDLDIDDVQADPEDKDPDVMPYFIISREGTFRGLYFPNRWYTLELNEPLMKDLFKKVEVPQSGSLKQELIYSGKKDDSIRLVYREFTEDMLRPSLFKASNYNLSSLNIIQLDDVIIEVMEATGSFIRYRIK